MAAYRKIKKPNPTPVTQSGFCTKQFLNARKTESDKHFKQNTVMLIVSIMAGFQYTEKQLTFTSLKLLSKGLTFRFDS